MLSRDSFRPSNAIRRLSVLLIGGLLALSGFGGLLPPTSVLAITTTASGTLAQSYVPGTTSFVVDVTSPCIFSGPNPVMIVGGSLETLYPSNISALNVPGPGQQTLATSTMAVAHPAGAVVTQTVPDCAASTPTPTPTAGPTGKLCITKFDDANGSGVQDPLEMLLPGFYFTVTDANGSVTPVTTGANGTVCIGLPAGNATVAENPPPPPWIQTGPLPLGPQTVTITTGQTTTIAFGNHNGPVPGTLCILKFNDLKGNGVQDASDPLLSGWTFNIQTNGAPTISIKTGPPVGKGCGPNQFSATASLLPGTYVVSEVIPLFPPGWAQTYPGPLSSQMAIIASGLTKTLVFGNHWTPPAGSAVPATPSPVVSLVPSPVVSLVPSPSVSFSPSPSVSTTAGATNPTSSPGMDQDGDGVLDVVDNCPTVINPDQLDANANGIGDACEFTMIAAGANDTCDIFGSAVHCWGDNQYGQTGNTNTISPQPSPVTAITSGATAVATSGQHTCAIVNGTVECWGNNNYGQIGNTNTISPQLTPVTVITSGATAIATGTYHTCAIVNGVVKCWGQNLYGQVGIGVSGAPQSSPVTVLGTSGATAIAAGLNSTCAVVGGIVKCWGDNATIQLSPVTVPGTSGATAVATSGQHTCAIAYFWGLGKCWGSNNYGQIGNGNTTTPQLTPTMLAFQTGQWPDISAITVGFEHTCGIVVLFYTAMPGGIWVPTDAVWCWGSNSNGQLGDGNATTSAQLTPVIAIAGIVGVTAIAAGSFHTCAIVSNTVECWGNNSSGQLGDGTLVDKWSPITVPGLAVAPSNQAIASNGPSANRMIAPPPPSSDPFIPVLIIVVLMVGLAAGAGLWFKGRARP